MPQYYPVASLATPNSNANATQIMGIASPTPNATQAHVFAFLRRLTCAVDIARGKFSIDLCGEDDGDDAEGQAAEDRNEDGPHEVIGHVRRRASCRFGPQTPAAGPAEARVIVVAATTSGTIHGACSLALRVSVTGSGRDGITEEARFAGQEPAGRIGYIDTKYRRQISF